ncbi:MAG: septum formation initiator family protein [Syntrophobacteraceae bacterium]
MNGRLTQNNRYQEGGGKPKFTIKGVYIVRSLVGFLLVLNIALIYTIVFSSNGIPGYKKQNEQVRELEEKIVKLRAENQRLFEMVQALKSSPEMQEKLVRQELGWVRENEIILDIPENEKEPPEKPAVPFKATPPQK